MNCLGYALNKWHEEGGYLVIRTTAHPTLLWRAGHVAHVGPEGLTHFCPGSTLGHPAQSIIGFDGVVWDRDLADAPPMPLRGVVLSALILAAGACGWALGRMIRGRVNG